MGENSDDNDPFEEDIVFDQSGLLTSRSSYSRQQINTGLIPTFMLFIRTVFLCVAFTGLGLCASVSQGPVIHLEVAVGIPIQKAFHSFTAHSVGMLIGGILGSVLFEIYNRQFLIFVSLLWMSVSVSVLPFTIPVSYWWTLINLAALGAGLSFLFTGSNVLCLDLWGKQGGASLQSLHFSFALGAFIAPIIIHPFISGTFPSEFTGVQKGNNFSTISVQPPAFYNKRIRREAENSLPDDMMMGKIENLSISSSLDNLTFPSEFMKTGNVIDLSSTVGPSVMENTSFSTTEIISDKSESDKIAPKPKPSFTNGNSIPESVDKWKRPPPKDPQKSSDSIDKAVDVVTNTTEKSAESKDVTEKSNNITKVDATNKSVTLPDIISTTSVSLTDVVVNNSKEFSDKDSNSTINSEQPKSKIENSSFNKTDSTITPSKEASTVLVAATTDSTLIGSPVIFNPASSLDNTTVSTNNKEKDIVNAITVTLSSSLDKTDNYSYESSVKVNISRTDTVTESVQSKATSLNNVVDTSPAPTPKKIDTEVNDALNVHEVSDDTIKSVTIASGTTPEDKKYSIEYNNNSYTYFEKGKDRLYLDDLEGQDFTDYSVNSVKEGIPEEKASIIEPELQDLKEYPSKENEASTISVTASFSNDGSSHRSTTNHQSKPGTYSNATDTNSRFFESLVERFKNYGVTSIHFVYICIGIFLLINAFISVIIMCHNPREPRSKQEDLSGTTLNKVFFGVFSIYMFASEAVEGAIKHLLASSQTENGIPITSKGLDGAAVFWGLVCVMRFLCILLFGFLKVKPGKVLVSSTFFTVVGTIFLCIGTFDKQDFLWGGIVVVALGLAPVLPTSFLWMAEHMRISHRMCAIMIVISSFGNSLTHLTLTHVLANSHMYAYILIGISLGAMIFLTVSFCLLYRAQRVKRLAVPIGYQLANQEEDETLELTRPTPKTFDNINRRLSDMGEAGQALLID